MPDPRSISRSPTVQLQDVVFILMRHKWKILTCSVLGLIAAGALFFVVKPDYQSTAKLLVRYVMDAGGVDAVGTDRRILTPDDRGENIINSEIEILTSWDLALSVADAVGPAKIVPLKTPGETNRNEAAAQITKNLNISVPKRSSVIVVTYRHRDPAMAQKVLAEVVDRYLERHLEVHRGASSFDLLTRQTDQLRSELNTTETQLQDLKRKAGVVTLLEGQQKVSADINRLEQSILESEAEYAGHVARLSETEKLAKGSSFRTNSAVTNSADQVETIVLEDYVALTERISILKPALTSLLIHYKEGHPEVQLLQRQIAEAIGRKKTLEVKYPALLTSPIVAAATAPTAGRDNLALDPLTERVQMAALDARLRILKAGLEKSRKEAATIDGEESQINQLERKKDQLVINYKYFSESLEKARVDAQLDPTKMPNISKVQEPCLPVKVASRLLKVVPGLAVAGLIFGIAWALLLDLAVDQRIRRPIEIESRLRIPLLLSIPFVERNGTSNLLPAPEPNRSGKSDLSVIAGAITDRSSWELSGFLRPFCEALRDRVTLYFHLKNVIRRPKLIAITGCGEGAGVTTLAAGLAAALAEIGDGKVLLVDANSSKLEADPFFRKGGVPGLAAALQSGRSDQPTFGVNFYLATATRVGDKTLPLVPRIYDLMPMLKASDYHYVIFDLPPMTQTSAALALAGLMDQVLLVVEADKTNRDTLKWAFNSLRQAEANVLGVFNKGRNQTPSWLHRGV